MSSGPVHKTSDLCLTTFNMHMFQFCSYVTSVCVGIGWFQKRRLLFISMNEIWMYMHLRYFEQKWLVKCQNNVWWCLFLQEITPNVVARSCSKKLLEVVMQLNQCQMAGEIASFVQGHPWKGRQHTILRATTCVFYNQQNPMTMKLWEITQP